jgi:hypothetical protein
MRRAAVVEIDPRTLGESQMDNSGCGSTDLIKLMTTEKDTDGIDASSFSVFLATPDVDRLLDNPEIRRARLLSKALEHLPLSKALELAQVAEHFLCGGPPESGGTTEVFSRPDAAKPVALPANDETPAVVSNGTGIEDHVSQSADILDFVVLASIDDITRYLGQHGDLIASKGDLFVANGQSEVTLDELLARANRLRVRQGLPTYAPLPAAFVVAAKAEPRPPKPPQPPCRKERERWARQVMEP